MEDVASTAGLQPVSSRRDVGPARDVLSRRGVWLVGSVGFVAVALHVYLSLEEVGGPWAGMLLELGAGVLLFAVFLALERRIVKRTVSSLLRKAEEEESRAVLENSVRQTPGDFYTGPMPVAMDFLGALASGDFETAWELADDNWRLCRVQAWIYNNREDLGLADAEAMEAACQAILTASRDNELAESFRETERGQFRNELRRYRKGSWGWSNRRRIAGPRHEIVLALPLPDDAPHGIVAEGPTLIEDAIKVLVSVAEVSGQLHYRAAGLMESAPVPGWPPTWWSIYDPVAESSHPGREVVPRDG